jgi:hypothetical protein
LSAFALFLCCDFSSWHVNDEPGRQVRHADRGIRRIDALSARTRGAVHVDPQVLVGEVDLDVLGSAAPATVTAEVWMRPCVSGDRHALHAVHAALELEDG